jgi:hypothetical protein
VFFPDITAQNARLRYDDLHSSSSMYATVIDRIDLFDDCTYFGVKIVFLSVHGSSQTQVLHQ